MRSSIEKCLVIYIVVSIMFFFSSCSKENEKKGVNSSTINVEIENPDVDADFEKACCFAREYSSDQELSNYYYLNALNKHPENSELWKEYVSSAIDYCDMDVLSTVYSNLDVAIISVKADSVKEMIELKNRVMELIIQLELDSSSNSDSVSFDGFTLSCENIIALFDEEEPSRDLIATRYAELLDEYYMMDDTSSVEAEFSKTSNLCQLLESVDELLAYGKLILSAEYDFSNFMNAMNLFDSYYLSNQYSYGTFDNQYKIIDSAFVELNSIFEDIKLQALSLLRKEVMNRRPSLGGSNAACLEELMSYQVFIQEVLQIVGNRVSMYDLLNEQIGWISSEINSITIGRQKAYQKWAYNVLVEAKSLDVKKAKNDDYYEYMMIDSSLLIPELQVIYGDLYDTISKKYKEFSSLVEYSVNNGLRTLEDF